MFQLEVEGLEGLGQFVHAELESKIDMQLENVFHNTIVPYAKSIAPVVTGSYQSSISAKKVGVGRWALTAGVHYAPYIEFGTQPHMIHAVNAKALRWVTKGGEVAFAKYVRHPGTSPQSILHRALADNGLHIINAYKKAVDELIKTDC